MEEKAKNTMTMWERLLRVYTDTKAFMQTKSWLAIIGMPHKSTNIIRTTLKQYIHNFLPMNYSVSKKWWSQASKHYYQKHQYILHLLTKYYILHLLTKYYILHLLSKYYILHLSQSITSCTFSQSITSCTFSQSITSCTFSQSINIK